MRALAAAQAMLRAGAFDRALAMLSTADAGPLEDPARARVDLLRAQIAFASRHGNEGAPLLLAAARRLEPLDAALARDTYLDAYSAAMFAGRLTNGAGLAEIAQAARRLPSPSQRSGKADLLLHGLTVLFTDGYPVATSIGRTVLQAFRSPNLTVEDGLRWLSLASVAAADLWDDESRHVLSARHVQMARDSGALSELPLAVNSRAVAHVLAGELDAAAVLVEELQAVQQATGTDLASYAALSLAAWQCREQQAGELIQSPLRGVVPRGEGIGVTIAQWASALLSNGLGRHEDALVAARQSVWDPIEFAAPNWGLCD